MFEFFHQFWVVIALALTIFVLLGTLVAINIPGILRFLDKEKIESKDASLSIAISEKEARLSALQSDEKGILDLAAREEELRDKVLFLEQSEKALNQSLGSLDMALTEKVAKSESLEASIKDELVKYHSIINAVTEKNSEKVHLDQTIPQLNEKKSSLDEAIKSTEEFLIETKGKESKRREDISIAEGELKEILKQVNDRKLQLEDIELNKTIKTLIVAELEKKKEALDQGIKDTEEKLIEIQESLNEMEGKKEELTAIETQINEEKLKLEDLELDKARINTIVDELKTKKSALDQQIKSSEDYLTETKGKEAELRKDIAVVEKELEEIIDLNEENKTQLEERKWKLEDLELDIARKTSIITAIENKKESLDETIEALKSEQNTLQESEQKWNDLQDDLDGKNDQIAALEAQIRNEEKPQNKALSFVDLEKPYFDESIDAIEGTHEKEKLKAFVSSMNNSYEFSERLIHAFHTSCKVQDYSTLTLLSGISGTGKSTIPRLYAEYFGMNFLLLPVKPSWTSMDDLIGYANPLENKFAAEALARAMWQFQGKLHNQVLLVLLDEMNLARVEYYFSDFLSRLELRKDISESSMNQKDISIDLGLGQDGEEKLLKLGRNIIFVGTMNEDESTLTISDKVVDRSNLIELGSPSSLNNRGSLEQEVSSFRLSYTSWSSWIKKIDNIEQDHEEIKKFYDDLNLVFGKFGRPFGHRLYSSALAYIENHPKRSLSISGNIPLSDQVAMHCLPKLKGVDKQRYKAELKNVENLLVQLEDPAIIISFRKALDSNNSVEFEWKGEIWNSSQS